LASSGQLIDRWTRVIPYTSKPSAPRG
jgi:hypothetical protein